MEVDQTTNKSHKTVFNWSGGKDSSLALYKILQQKQYDVVALLTTVNRDSKKSTMHNIPNELLERQAERIGIPLYIVDLIPEGNMADYEREMTKAVNHFKDIGVTHFVFGDIFLQDIYEHRKKNLEPHGITVVEPLWGKTSEKVMQEFFASGLKTIIVTTMADVLGEKYIGKHIDQTLVNDMPENADICGENGEYHTFCYAGPIFSSPVPYTLGKPTKKTFNIKLDDGTSKDYSYWFANLDL
ncbi:hypothetical protein BB559_000579 [Furculomyces boomerangus]|uniref:Diphthine--ammonia ligase n=2 Tax=Harpellales TaxID=61421 RepID=A0A2T9XZ05_9FUNG|nr:hypothetical protein BB559_007089 [Furculomyces boomerangus]PVU94913.1 hypothetical protein BB559_002884 [Furculomyces boomerangus]PVU99599.1 hypothetical protein BB559_000579 [Furculomyces boomerangus]PWA00958.1 hypothetical protein BB558_002997 [Smittium angustum]